MLYRSSAPHLALLSVCRSYISYCWGINVFVCLHEWQVFPDLGVQTPHPPWISNCAFTVAAEMVSEIEQGAF